MKVLAAIALILASTTLVSAETTTYTGIACAMQADADTLVSALAQMPELTIGASAESAQAQLVATGDACVSFEANAKQIANAEFVTAKGGEQIGMTQIGGQHFVFVDGIPPNF